MFGWSRKVSISTLICLLVLSVFISQCLTKMPVQIESSSQNATSFVIAVHAGAGSYTRSALSFEKEAKVKEGLLEALIAGYEVLVNNGSHLEATREAIIKMEDNPLFNAAKGGKLNRKFEVELDASIMDGSNLKCGAVAAVKTIKNPIKAAELVMNSTPHILLVGDSADKFAEINGLSIVPNFYFFTEERIKEWFDARADQSPLRQFPKHKMGTIGAVARDSKGHLSAATSTGGITYKMAGRVGDSPIIGAGNYANDLTCAVSCTGAGEEMMRRVMAFDIHARMLYKGDSLKTATEEVLSSCEEDTGGFIAVDKHGNVEMPYNSGGMARAYVKQDGVAYIYIFEEGADLTPVEYHVRK